MNRVNVGNLSRADHLRNVQVAFRAARRADANRLVRKPHVQRIAVRLRIHRDRANVEFLARRQNAQRDFPTVGDQDFSEHDLRSACRGKYPAIVSNFYAVQDQLFLRLRPNAEEPLAILHRLTIFYKNVHDFARCVGLNLVHQLHRFDNAEHLADIDLRSECHKRRCFRAGRRIERSHNGRLHDVDVGADGSRI